jgi:hypothetical protein
LIVLVEQGAQNLTIKITHLRPDDPTLEDEFGSHSKVAALIADEIVGSNEGRSIAVIGDWGSGKSTVLKLIEARLEKPNSPAGKKADARVFSYDAWSHQGDPLRRSFLDDLINFLNQQKLITDNQAREIAERVWNRQEITTVTVEPIARKHALILLLSLAIIPLGLKLIELPTKQSESLLTVLLSGRNLFALGLIIAPLPLIVIFGLINKFGPAALKKFLFGISAEDVNFSVLSFFFQKTQGTRERKLVKTPADSIIEFKNIFNDLLDKACISRSDLRIVIIIDNIDRIPADHAKEFWSTMQTFFADEGGLKKPRTRKYWLVAPFSLNALSFIFKDTAEGQGEGLAEEKAKAYVDKTFGMTLNVPPPILANWRKYLLKQLEAAFPESETEELITVRDVYGISIQQMTRVTPRDLKLFVNALVVLYRQRGNEISLPLMASFLIHRNDIRKTGITDSVLSAQELRIVDDLRWRAMLAGLYYGVTPDEGNQILLQEPIQKAIGAADAAQLKQLEDQPGFEDVLSIVVRSELETVKDGLLLCRIASTISPLKAADGPALRGLWKQLRQRLKNVSDWGNFAVPVDSGLKAIFTNSPQSEHRAIIDSMAKSLSKSQVSNASGSTPIPISSHWLQAAITVIAQSLPTPPEISIPGSPQFKLETLQQLATADVSDEIKSSLKFSPPLEIVSAIVGEISAGRTLREPEKFIGLITQSMKIKLEWLTIVQAAATRLRVDGVAGSECRQLIALMISALTVAGDNSVINLLKDLSTQGILPNFLHHNNNDQEVRAAIVLATFLANPKYERPQQRNQSAEGDARYNELTKGPKFDSDLIDRIATFVVYVRATRLIFEIGAQNPNIAGICAATIGRIANKGTELDIASKAVVDNRQFIESQVEFIDLKALLVGLKDRAKILGLLSGQAFQIDRCRLYRAALNIMDSDESGRYLSFLHEGIQSLPEADWDKALNSSSGPYLELVSLCSDLQGRIGSFVLSIATRDAILEQIRKVGRGKTAISQDVRDRLIVLLNLIPQGQQQSLFSDVIDDLMAASDPLVTERTVDFVGNRLSGDLLSEEDPDRVVRRIFNPALSESEKVEKSIFWIGAILESHPKILESADLERRTEFATRLQNAFEAASEKSGQADLIQRIASKLNIDIAHASIEKTEEDVPSSEKKEKT